MKITEEFIGNSILDESLFKTIIEVGSDEILTEIILMFFEEMKSRFEMLLQITEALKQGSYTEARKYLKHNGEFFYFANEMPSLRRALKSLMWGLIKTSSISTVNEIAQYKIEWNRYDNIDKTQKSDNYHHYLIYQQFKKVETLDELVKFNALFHQYLVEMVFKLAEILIRRMTYTIEYLQNDEAFKEVCGEATLNLRNFRNEIEKLKRRPLDINHGGTENT
jgi:hypothetical protein